MFWPDLGMGRAVQWTVWDDVDFRDPPVDRLARWVETERFARPENRH